MYTHCVWDLQGMGQPRPEGMATAAIWTGRWAASLVWCERWDDAMARGALGITCGHDWSICSLEIWDVFFKSKFGTLENLKKMAWQWHFNGKHDGKPWNLAIESPQKSKSSNGTSCSKESRHPDHRTIQLLHGVFSICHTLESWHCSLENTSSK